MEKAEYKGFEYNWDYDEIDKEIRVWFYYNSDPCRAYCWKYFETESNFKTFIDLGIDAYVLSLEEAKHIAITEGKKIRHKYFLDSEYIYFDRGWKTEDGYDLPFAYFLGMDENWQTGWSEHRDLG